MRIAIDVSQVVYSTGVSSYTKNLVTSLLSVDKSNDYVLFGGGLRKISELRAFYKTLRSDRVDRKIFPFPPSVANIVWNKLHAFPIEYFIGKVDVFHSSDWTQPPSKALKVTTIHDLVPLLYPHLSSPKIVSAHKLKFEWIKKEVDAIIVPSVTTKKDLLSLGVKKDSVTVIAEAPDSIFKPSRKAEIEKVKRKYSIVGKYLLSVGITPRKNTKRIIKAFFKANLQKSLNLVIIGQPFVRIEPRRGLITPGVVSGNDMPALYSGAQALVYPSLYEGYGLPILEAYACKIPVITSNLGSLKEVAGDACVLVNPESADSIEKGIIMALENKEELVSKGVKRVKKFSWRKNAEDTLKVYRRIHI